MSDSERGEKISKRLKYVLFLALSFLRRAQWRHSILLLNGILAYIILWLVADINESGAVVIFQLYGSVMKAEVKKYMRNYY